MTAVVAEYAWVGDRPQRDVRIDVANGRIAAVGVGSALRPGDRWLPGLTVPGFANTHSHAFHRALRGRTHGAGSFWTWREQMYRVAGALDPDRYLALARATFAEMALAGVTSVGEFHYLHHRPGGTRYADPNAMGEALLQAAADAGIRITLLDTCYLAGGLGDGHPQPLAPDQEAFGDGNVGRWIERVAAMTDRPGARIGVAAHSVRAVPRDALAVLAEFAHGRPLHVHVSEQRAENEECLAAYGVTPVALLAEAGVLGPDTTAVHATHVSDEDVAVLGSAGTFVSFCPTTERDLADGIGPAGPLCEAGAVLTLGSDQHATIDLLEEARALEMDERLRTGTRGVFSAAQALRALTVDGQRSLGWDDAGEIAVGRRADLTSIRLDTVRTAGADPAQAMFAATATDVPSVIVDGEPVVTDGEHRLGDVANLLASAVRPLFR